jgi:hypothetical protein
VRSTEPAISAKLPRWRVDYLAKVRSTLGTVEALDEKSAVAEAVRQFKHHARPPDQDQGDEARGHTPLDLRGGVMCHITKWVPWRLGGPGRVQMLLLPDNTSRRKEGVLETRSASEGIGRSSVEGPREVSGVR